MRKTRTRYANLSTLIAVFAAMAMYSPRMEAAPATTTAELPSSATDGEKDEVDAAIDRGIAFLLKQQHDDGYFSDTGKFETTLTSLTLMSMAAIGHQPSDSTPAGRAMRRGLAFVLREDRQTPVGYFGHADASRMYGHGITTFMLTEMLGMAVDAEQDKLIRKKCQKAVDMILRAQRADKRPQFVGGWRYRPDSTDADLSVSVWQVVALRSAHNAGLDVPTEAIDKAVAYIKRSYFKEPKKGGKPGEERGGFFYTIGPKPDLNKLSPPMQGAGLLALQVCGRYDEPEVEPTADWLLENPPRWDPYHGTVIYALYYYSQAMHQRGGKYAATAHRVTRELLLENQSKDGSWDTPNLHERSYGSVCRTSMAILALAVKYKYLPIYQR